MGSMPKIIVTGSPGSGKTTLVERLIERVPGAQGFLTKEMRSGGERIGFLVVSSDGSEAVLSRKGAGGGPRVGKYLIDVAAFERVAVPVLRDGAKKATLIYVDEIGKMELFSQTFAELVWAALQSCKPFLATMGRVKHPLVERIRARPDVEIIELNAKNRDRLVDELIERLSGD